MELFEYVEFENDIATKFQPQGKCNMCVCACACAHAYVHVRACVRMRESFGII